MKYYAQIGMSEIIIDETTTPVCPDGYIEMQSDRPDGDYIANVDGNWVLREKTASDVRAERNAKLSETDYLMLTDSALTTEQNAEFVAYRQALRDVTAQPGFPNDVVWPTKPEL